MISFLRLILIFSVLLGGVSGRLSKTEVLLMDIGLRAKLVKFVLVFPNDIILLCDQLVLVSHLDLHDFKRLNILVNLD